MTSIPSRILAGADTENEPKAEETEPENQAAEAEPAAVEENVETEAVATEEVVETAPEVVEEAEVAAAAEEAAQEEVVEAVPETAPTAEILEEKLVEETVVEAAPAPVLEVVSVKTSLVESKDAKGSIRSMDGKIQYIYEPIPEDLLAGISIMKEQIELAMEQINILTKLEMRAKRNSFTKILKDLNKKMRRIQKSNNYIETRGSLLEMYESEETEDIFEEVEEEELEEEETEMVVEKKSIVAEKILPLQEEYEPPTLSYHLCYSPEKMMDELMELKSEFCHMTNKVNNIMAALTEMESHRTKTILCELQEQMRDVRYLITLLKDSQEILDQKLRSLSDNVNEVGRHIETLRKNKVDRVGMELALAEKVDYKLLETKVSHEQMREVLCRIEKQFCEMQQLINFNEKHALQIIENMRKNLGLDTIDQMLKDFRNKVDQDIEKLLKLLQDYMDATNDDCAAAGARVKVLKDLACISCDTNCVMRTMEKSKVGKLPNAHVTPGIAPLVTYELGSIRKSGLMGYYRKDEFPHAPNAWLNRKGVSLKICVPRHAGGEHTTYTAKDRVEKVVIAPKRAKQ